MASWNIPALVNKIADDIPGLGALVRALATWNPTGEDIPEGAKRLARVPGGVQAQTYENGAWASTGKLMHDADTLDGFHASTGTAKNTVPVRDAEGKLPGDLSGNAATASRASALAAGCTVPVGQGGTGGTSASAARANLGADNAANITKGTLSAARGGTGRTDGCAADVVIDDAGTKAKDVGQLGRAKNLKAVNADTLRTQGRYAAAGATTALNYPFAGDALLEVVVWGDANITQIVSENAARTYEMVRTSSDAGATWGAWLPRSGSLNGEAHIYAAKDGSDKNAGYSADKPVLTVNAVISKMLFMKPGAGKSFILHFGPGDWGNVALTGAYASGAPIMVTSTAAANATTETKDMPRFGTLSLSSGLLASLRNVEADFVDSTYDSCAFLQYYNKIGATRARHKGRIYFDVNAHTAIKTQTVQTDSFIKLYSHGMLDILNGATFDLTENVSYAAAFLYASGNSEINIGGAITAASFANAARCTGKRFALDSCALIDPNTGRDAFPGTLAGVYTKGNLINGMATEVAVSCNTQDTASSRGQIGDPAIVSAAADLNAYTRSGHWFFAASAVSKNFPSAVAGFLSVDKGQTFIRQTYRAADADRAWERRFSGAWSAWTDRAGNAQVTAGNAQSAAQRAQTTADAALSAAETLRTTVVSDWNEARLPGFYKSSSETPANNPIAACHGSCIVSGIEDKWLIQTWFGFGKSTDMYRRACTNGGWSSWVRIGDNLNGKTAHAEFSDRAGNADAVNNVVFHPYLCPSSIETNPFPWFYCFNGGDDCNVYVKDTHTLSVNHALSADVLAINYGAYNDFSLNADFTMPYDGLVVLYPQAGGWGYSRLYVDGMEVGRARLYGEDSASPADTVSAIIRAGHRVQGQVQGNYVSGFVRCFIHA